MNWHNAKTNPPEPLTDVLLAVCGQTQSAEGFRLPEANRYVYSDGHDVTGDVYAWAELPTCPVIIPGTGEGRA